MKNRILPVIALLALLQSCVSNSGSTESIPATQPADTVQTSAATQKDSTQRFDPENRPKADAATILAKKQVPILCYHDLRDWKPNETSSMKVYVVPVATFKDQIKSLADSGYQTITPEDYYNYLNYDAPLPDKPVMITFDDTDLEQYTIGATELDKYGFKGVFFIMNISIGKPRYMNKEQIKELSDKGHVIGAHSWDHHNARNYTEQDWDKQLTEPKQKLEAIIGKPVEYFAYPFGSWNTAAIPHLKKRGMKGAFQLAAKRDTADPVYTLRRILVPGTWNRTTMQKWMKANF